MHCFIALIFSSSLLLLLSTNRCFVYALNLGKPIELEELGVTKGVCSGNRSGGGVGGECSEMEVEEAEMEMEMEMDSEINKRILLMQKKFISYDTLKRDMVPCNTPGASYYNCRGNSPANSYSRGCQMITRCDRGG